MILFKTTAPLKKELEKLRKENLTIGFVPTMGALHQGHITLIEASKKQYDITVCSIFVNPAQFNDKKDFEKYPITIEQDIYLLETNKTDILFLPSVDEIYSDGLQQLKHFNLSHLENILEGKFRPGHFQGVCNVVYRLLNGVMPDAIFLGQKDYQQCLVLKKIILEYFPAINVSLVDIKREKSGLAMSSRNMRLSNEAKEKAAVINRSLQFIKKNIFNEPLQALKDQAKEKILKQGFDKIDYIEICNAENLLPVTNIASEKMIVLAAAFIEGVRLIDNVMI